jgi:hypothetical protein
MWEAVVDAEPRDDPAMISMRNEATRVLARMNRARRVLASGRAGQPAP